MKKRFGLFLAFITIVIGSNAQPYGHATYAYSGVYLTSGHVTNINTSNGNILAGYIPITTGGNPSIVVYKTASGGGFNAGTNPIKMEYEIWDNSLASCTTYVNNQILNCSGVSIIETNVASPSMWYAMVGAYPDGLFFTTLDNLGNPVTEKKYLFPTSGQTPSKPIIAESVASPNNYYIGGYNQLDSLMYIMKVNSAGTIAWSKFYNSGGSTFEPKGIIESPYSSDLIVVGLNVPPASLNRASDGFFLKLNPSTGAVNSYSTYGSSGSVCQQFNSIRVANSSTGGQGFIIGGASDPISVSPGAKNWAIKLGNSGNIIWTTLFLPTTNSNNLPGVVDVIERQNTTPVYEYYAALGECGGAFGMKVLKIDDSGNPFSTGNNEFVYNVGSTNGSGISCLDFINATNIGLRSYGTDDVANGGKFYQVNSYFNGLANSASCSETLTTIANYETGPNSIATPWINTASGLSGCSNFDVRQYPVTVSAVGICNATSIGGGSNARTANPFTFPDESDGVFINDNYINTSTFPNPVENKTNHTFNVYDKSYVKIVLYNNVGQFVAKVYDKTVEAGEYKVDIDFKNLNLESGLYFIDTNINGKSESTKIMYTK